MRGQWCFQGTRGAQTSTYTTGGLDPRDHPKVEVYKRGECERKNPGHDVGQTIIDARSYRPRADISCRFDKIVLTHRYNVPQYRISGICTNVSETGDSITFPLNDYFQINDGDELVMGRDNYFEGDDR